MTDIPYSNYQELAQNLDQLLESPLNAVVKSKSDVILDYHFNEGKGKIVKDECGNHYDGNLEGVNWEENGVEGTAVTFNDRTDHISTKLKTKGFNWTTSMWVKLDGKSLSEAIIMESPDGRQAY